MEFIGILIVVCIIYYLKKKKDERDSAADFQIQPDYTDISSKSNFDTDNPFIE